MAYSSAVDDISKFVSQTGTSAGKRALDSNYQDFLHLLTVQLQNQDPTDPTDTNQLTQQIATLSQVEQQINTNKNLEQLIQLYNATQYNSVVGYIGKQIEAEGNVGALENGEARFAYYLEREAENVAVTIKNSSGSVVYTGPGGTKLAGRNEYMWDGKNNAGNDQPPGTYTIKVKATDGSNNAINSKTFITGVVKSVDSLNGGVYLSFGDIAVPVEKVISIRMAPEQQG